MICMFFSMTGYYNYAEAFVAPSTFTRTISEEEGLVQVCGLITNSNGGIAESQKNITVFYTTNSGTALGKL